MAVDVKAEIGKKANNSNARKKRLFFESIFCFLISFYMTTLISKWFKQLFIHQASSERSLKTCPSNQSYQQDKHAMLAQQIPLDRSCLLGETMTDRCMIVDQPSTMSDAEAMHCDEQENENRNFPTDNSTETKEARKDTIVIDKFQACFIDCTCQCEVMI